MSWVSSFPLAWCSSGRTVPGFGLICKGSNGGHAAPEDEAQLPEWLAGFRTAAASANVVGMFDCQGQLSRGMKRIMLLLPMRGMRQMAKRDNSQVQPDATRPVLQP